MKNKSFLSKLDELKPIVPVHIEVERKLIPRLKLMGYVLLSFSLAAFVFAITIKEETLIVPEATQETLVNTQELEAVTPLLTDDAELEFAATEVLNFYVVSLVFAMVGSSLFVIAWKKTKVLFHEPQINKD
jgi:hypothetical protein